MSGRLRWLRPATASAAAACGLAASAWLAPASNAATISSARPAAAPPAVSTAHAAAGRVIVCRAIANNPHDSKHGPGTVNFIGQVKCDARVRSISMIATLSYKGHRLVVKSGSNRNEASLTKQLDAACRNGNWTGTVSARIIAPPGYRPPVAAVYAAKTAHVTCRR